MAFVDGVTAAAAGAITGAVIVLGRRTLFENGEWVPELPKVVILLVTVAVLWRFKKLPEPIVVLAAAIAGLVLYPIVKQ